MNNFQITTGQNSWFVPANRVRAGALLIPGEGGFGPLFLQFISKGKALGNRGDPENEFRMTQGEGYGITLDL